MNKQTFEHLVQTNKKNRTKPAKQINHLQDKDFIKWLNNNGLINWIK